MKKRFYSALFVIGLSVMLALAACSQSGTEPSGPDGGPGSGSAAEQEAGSGTESATAPEGAAYGYAGEDPIELAVYRYLVEEVSKSFDAADASIPVVQTVSIDDSNPDEVLVSGSFWIFNYDIEGDTLMCVSGGSFPGVMHVVKDGDAYTVGSFDVVADGAGFDESAHELFGDDYDAFMAILSDDAAREGVRTGIVSDYVSMNGLEVTQYQDYGWDPVPLDL